MIRLQGEQSLSFMRFQNLARHPDIGCNSYLLEFGSTRFVLDSGSHPKHTGKSTLPLFEELEYDSVDAILLSHPHLDHIGSLPRLMKQQPNATVCMTEETRQFGGALLHNSVNVMKAQRKELNEPSYPLYSHREVEDAEKTWYTRRVGERFSLGESDRVECEFFQAGHVLGAVGIQMKWEGRTIFYTGDVHFEDQTMTKGAEFPEGDVDTLIIETTRGDNIRPEDYAREAEKQRLGSVIDETLRRGGSVLIPVFAFGKTQELLLMLHELFDEGHLPYTPVHIGGLSTRMTTITDSFSDHPGRHHRGYKLLDEFPGLEILPRGRSEPEYQRGHIYALSSGMMSENTVSHRFSRHILSNPANAMLFVGFAEESTPGGRILEAGQGGRVRMNSDSDHESPILCDVHKFDFSGHSPREQIADYAVSRNPKTVILVHGDPPAKSWFYNNLRERLPHSRIVVPKPGQSVDL